MESHPRLCGRKISSGFFRGKADKIAPPSDLPSVQLSKPYSRNSNRNGLVHLRRVRIQFVRPNFLSSTCPKSISDRHTNIPERFLCLVTNLTKCRFGGVLQ